MLSPVIGGFEIRERLGERNGVATYRAVSTTAGEPVLLRVARDDGAAKRLRARARGLVGKDVGPNVRPVLRLDAPGGQVIAVSPDAGGWRLADLARRDGFDDGRSGRIAAQVERAAHELRKAGLAPDAFDPADVWIERRGETLHAVIDPLESTGAGPAAKGDLSSVMPLLAPAEDLGHRRETSRLPGPRSAARNEGATIAGGLPLWVVGGAGAMVALIGVIVALDGDDRTPRASSPVSVSTTGTTAGANVVEIAIPATITAGPVFAEGVGWLADSDQMTLLPIDPRSGRQSGDRLEIGPGTGRPLGLRPGAGALWAVDSAGGRVARIDPKTRRITGRFEVPPRILAFSVDAAGVGVIRRDDTFAPSRPTRLVRFDQATLKRKGESGLPRPATGAASAAGDLLVSLGSGVIARVGPGGRVRRSRDVGASARISAIGLGSVWVTNPTAAKLLRLDPETLATRDTYTAPEKWIVADLDIGPLGVYALLRQRGGGSNVATRLQALNPANLEPAGEAIALSAPATTIVQSEDAIWASAPKRLLKVTLAR